MMARPCGQRGGLKPKVPKRQTSYLPQSQQLMVEFVRSGRSPDELGEEWEPAAQLIRNWVAGTTGISVVDRVVRKIGATSGESSR